MCKDGALVQVEVRDVPGERWLPSIQHCVADFSSVVSTFSLEWTVYFQCLI